MSRASRAKLPDKTIEAFQSHLSSLLSSLTKNDDLDIFFNEFLTPEEKVMLSKRVVLFLFIHRGYAPSTITNALHLSYETVRIYMNQYPLRGDVFRRYIEKLSKRDETNEFFQKMDKVFKPINFFLQAKSNMKARAKLLTPDES